MKTIGDTVRFRDDQNVNFTALVIEVHSEDCVSLVYCPAPGTVERVNSVMHRRTLKPPEVKTAGGGVPPGKHWIG